MTFAWYWWCWAFGPVFHSSPCRTKRGLRRALKCTLTLGPLEITFPIWVRK